MEIVNKYFKFMYYSMVSDLNSFDHWWMWAIIPAVIWAVILLFKWAFICLPLMLPSILIRGIVRSVMIKTKKKLTKKIKSLEKEEEITK